MKIFKRLELSRPGNNILRIFKCSQQSNRLLLELKFSCFRGACNAILLEKEKVKGEMNFLGVVTHSSGNHGQAVAWAASQGNLCFLVLQIQLLFFSYILTTKKIWLW